MTRWQNIPQQNWPRARLMRHESTEAEQRLWSAVRSRQLGVKFCRQHPIGPYIADLYAPRAKLVVEVDGGEHLLPDQVEYDRERTEYLEARGISVIRFFNGDVMRHLAGVLTVIQHTIEELRAASQ